MPPQPFGHGAGKGDQAALPTTAVAQLVGACMVYDRYVFLS
jgi:hypothetical protein